MPIDPHKRSSSQSSDHANDGGNGPANDGLAKNGAGDGMNSGKSSSDGKGERSGRRSRSGKSGKSRSSSSGKSSSHSSGKSKAGLGKQFSRSAGKITEAIEKGFRVFADAFGGVIDMILAVLFPKNLRKKVDKLGKSKKARRVSKKVGKQVGQLTDNVEKSFKKGASGFFEVFGFLFAIIVPKFIRDRVEKFWKAIGSRFSKFFKRLNKGMASWAEKYLPPWMVQLIKRTNQRIKRARKNSGKFANAWFKSRDFLNLAWATPAILMAVPMGAILALSAAQSAGDKMRHYERAAFQYDQDELYEFGSLCRKRLTKMGFKQLENAKFTAALQLARKDNYAEAYLLMQEIAPLTQGFLNSMDRPEVQVETDSLEYQLNLAESSSQAITDAGGMGISTTVTDSFDEAAYATFGSSAEEAVEESSEAEPEFEDMNSFEAQIAPYQDNFMRAHIWIGMGLLQGKITELTDQRKWRLIREHARIANLLHRRSLGEDLYASTDKYEDANGEEVFTSVQAAIMTIECDREAMLSAGRTGAELLRRMRAIVNHHKPYHAHLMRYYHASRGFRGAVTHARDFIEYLGTTIGYDEKKRLAKQNKMPSETQVLALVEAFSILNKPTIAEQLAEDGAKQYPDSDILRSLEALVYRKKLYALNPFGTEYSEQLLELHRLSPDNVDIVKELAQQLKNGQATKDLDQLMAEGKAGVMLIMEVADDAQLRAKSLSDFLGANRLYDEAIKAAPNFSRAYNNKALAVVEIAEKSPDPTSGYEDALSLVNKAIEFESDATYYETRGNILIQLRRWDEAIADLSFALNGNLTRTDLLSAHAGLERCYTATGRTELAAIHASEARKLQIAGGSAERLGN